MAANPGAPSLRRELGLLDLCLAGLGIILGAGIYALIGEASAEAGALVWLSFVIAAAVTVFTGLSYAELGAMYPQAGAGYEYARRAFGIHVAFVTGWLTVIAGIVAAATVALGFGGYLHALTGFDSGAGAILLLAAGSAVAATGALGSVRVAAILTVVEATGLLLVSAIGLLDFEPSRVFEAVGPLPVLGGAALVFFAYIGFEDLATLSEEVRDPARNIPRAIIISVVVSTAIYVLVAVSAVGAVGAEALAGSDAPLALVGESVFGTSTADVLSAFALAATSNTALLLLTAACRHIYGMASTGALPRAFGRISGGARVPLPGLLAAASLAALVTLWGDIGVVADVTNFGLFIAFAVVNLALIRLRRTATSAPRAFVSPGTITLPGYGKAPLLPVLAIATIAPLFVSLKPESIAAGTAVLAAGIILAVVFRRQHDAAGSDPGVSR
ncbi:MAG: amino acid permease [Chloroflexi bacterium]|nr:amino acid permease [Chloroflexota bacterium]